MHVALAGYADLPLAGFLTLTVLSAFAWRRSREPGDGLLALFFLAALPLIKVPGRIWAAILLPGLVVALFPRHGLKLVGAGIAIALVGLLVLAQTHPVVLNYTLHFEFAPAWGALADSFFLLGNWHLLWYAAIAVAAVGFREVVSPRLAPLSVIVAIGALFLLVVFTFTNARDWVTDQTTVNRATLHLAPVVLFWALAVARAWYVHRAAREVAMADTVTEPETAT
jgi:hypothetical protein